MIRVKLYMLLSSSRISEGRVNDMREREREILRWICVWIGRGDAQHPSVGPSSPNVRTLRPLDEGGEGGRWWWGGRCKLFCPCEQWKMPGWVGLSPQCGPRPCGQVRLSNSLKDYWSFKIFSWTQTIPGEGRVC